MMFATGTLLKALLNRIYAISAAIAILSGCGLVDNTLRGTLGTPGFFSVESGSELIVIPEGDTAHISFTLSDPAPEAVTSYWEIFSGSGEFSIHEGSITISQGATLAQLPAITALTDAKLEGNTNYKLVISSKRFKNKGKKLEITIRVTDQTQPAALEFSSSPLHTFTAALVGAITTDVITITNSGDAQATNLSFAGLAAPFSYVGGSFPGTGGSCADVLAGNDSCTVNLAFSPAAPGTFNGTLKVDYKDYKSNQSSTLPLEGVSAVVVAEIDEDTAPNDPSNETMLDIDIGGSGITGYRYKIGAQSVTDCTVETGYEPEIAESTNISIDIGPTGHNLGDGMIRLCVVGTNGVLWQPFVAATTYEWKKDTAPPVLLGVVINSGDAYTNDQSVDLEINGTVLPSEMLITNSATCTPGIGEDYESYFDTKSNWALGAPDGLRTVSVRLRDEAGNTSDCRTDTIFLDTIPPNAPANDILGATPYVLTATPTITYDAAVDPAPSSLIDRHEVRVYNSDGDVSVTSWVTHTSGDALGGMSLTEGEEYYFLIRGVDMAGNLGTTTKSDPWIASGPVEVTIGGAPTGTNNTTVLAVEITGQPNITEYRSKVGVTGTVDCTDIAGYGAITDKDADITTDIGTTGLNLPDGSITLCLIGSNGILWQPVSSPTTATWTKDTAPPHTLSLVINSGDGYTNDDEVGLTLSAVDAVEMYVTNDSTCASGGDWAAYATSVGTWPLGQTEATATVYVKFKDAYGNETDCSTYDSIVHDSQDPNPPNTIVLGATPPSVTESPEITFTSGGDNGPAGVLKFQIQIHLESDDSVVAGGGWQDFTSGGSVSGLTWMTSLELLPLQI